MTICGHSTRSRLVNVRRSSYIAHVDLVSHLLVALIVFSCKTKLVSSAIGDGLRHFAYQKAKRFYNNTTMSDIHDPANSSKPKDFLGIQNFAEQGIVSRGILVDFARWSEQKGSEIDFSPFRTDGIKIEWLKEILKDQGTEVQFGDILIVRSGFMKAYKELSKEDIQKMTDVYPPPCGGVMQSEQCTRWLLLPLSEMRTAP